MFHDQIICGFTCLRFYTVHKKITHMTPEFFDYMTLEKIAQFMI